MPGILINPSSQWVDDDTVARQISKYRLISVSPNHYTFALRGKNAAGSLVARVGGGYVITVGNDAGPGFVAKAADGTVIVF